MSEHKQHIALVTGASRGIGASIAHELAQQYQDPLACWLHAVLHKIEGDEFNSRYWYAKSQLHDYHDYSDAQSECLAIAHSLQAQS